MMLPKALGPYQHYRRSGNLLYLSGQIPLNPATDEINGKDIVTQTNQVLTNIKAILEKNQLAMKDVVKTTVFMSDLSQFTTMNEVYAEYFVEPYPVRSTVQIAKLPKGSLVEIEAIAEFKD